MGSSYLDSIFKDMYMLVYFSENCRPSEHNGFMKYVCSGQPHKNSAGSIFRCSSSSQYYSTWKVRQSRNSRLAVSDQCDKRSDQYYQTCGLSTKSSGIIGKRVWSYTKQGNPCGMLCTSLQQRITVLVTSFENSICNQLPAYAEYECAGNSWNATARAEMCQNERDKKCDGTCSGYYATDCIDERVCNGYSYGIFSLCPANSSGQFLTAHQVQSRTLHCDLHDDACRDTALRDFCIPFSDLFNSDGFCTIKRQLKDVTDQGKHIETSDILIPLFNFSRCGPLFIIYGYDAKAPLPTPRMYPLCDGFFEQTNCSDPALIGLQCKIRGFPSTVSRRIVCNENIVDLEHDIPLCDDKIDKECLRLSLSCFIHKHQLCDGSIDCVGGEDETADICSTMARSPCTRRLVTDSHHGIPIEWIKDGVADCSNEEDEHGVWPSCGSGRTHRYVVNETETCAEVYLCQHDFIILPDLCDGKKSCGNRDTVCSKSRHKAQVFTSPMLADGVNLILYCLPGLQEFLHELNAKCIHRNFTYPTSVFGRNSTIKLFLPLTTTSKINCEHTYGSIYVYLSCLNICKHAVCPITKPLWYHSCLGQFPSRVYSWANNSYLTFLSKRARDHSYHNEIFPCNNGLCVSYDRVCNLFDDCGDNSDELNCTNTFV